MAKVSVLMVCSGNICRSPIAEAVLRNLIEKQNSNDNDWFVDSAGTEGYHCGESADERAINVLKNHGIEYSGIARKVLRDDFFEFDYIFAVDKSSFGELKKIAPKEGKARVFLLSNFGLDGSENIIVDPYYWVGETPFETVYEQCEIACKALLKDFEENNI